MIRFWFKTSALLVTALYGASSFAATAGTSTAATESTTAKILKNTSVTDYSLFFGPAVTDPTSSTTADNAEGATMPLTSLHFTAVNYKLDEKTKISPTAEWMYNFTTSARGPVLNDPFIQLSRSNLASTTLDGGHKLDLNGHARWYLPVNRYLTKGAGAVSQLRAGLTPSIQFANSNFSVAALTYARTFFYDAGGAARREMVRIYAGPQVNYTVNSRVTAFVLLEAEERFYNIGPRASQTGFSNTDIQPGAEIQVIADRLTLVPYLNWFLNQSIKTTSINLNADIKLF